MALFKIEKGLAANLATNRPNSVEGYCYFTSDDGKFYIDIATGTALTPAENGGKLAGATRMPINSYLSDWAVRAYSDRNGNDITCTYGNRLSLSDKYTLKLIASDSTELGVITLPKDVDTASKFTSAQTIELTGAVTGRTSSQAGWIVETTLANNIVKTVNISDKAVTNEKLANSSITIGGKTVNLGGTLTLADIGLNTALRFIGATSTAITDGSTTSSIVINGSNVTPTIGDVIINNNNSQEYVWLGSAWELLGDESSYALKTITISGSNGLTGSGTLSGNITLSHADTSNQDSISASGRRYITGVTLDTYGHVTGLTTGTETVTDTHYTTKLFATGSSGTAHDATTNGNTYLRLFDNNTARQSIKIVGSGATTVTSDANGIITISSTDNNTTYGLMSIDEGATGAETINRVLNAANLKGIINAHAPTKTGTGASGTWGINITGNAATATKFDTATNVTLTGDITGSSSSQKGWNIKTTIGEGKVTNAMLAGSISNDKLTNSYFTIKEGSIDHNISLGGQVLSKDLATWLGLSKIMSFVGISNDAKLVNGYTGTPTIKEGQTNYTTKTPGDTVLHETTGKQFIWTGTSWYEIGNGLLYDLQGTAAGLIATLDVNDTDGGTNNFVSAVKQTDGKINVTHKALVTTGKWAGEAGSVAWANITGKPSTFTPSEHTHNYAGSASAGGAANSAVKVNNNLIIKLNSGSTEGTNLFTFNGSTEKTINITPAAIGAAAASHGTHVSYGTTASAISTAASAGTATTVSRSDHVHSLDKATVVAALGYTPPVENHNHDSSYVKKSGDTMTGNLTVPTVIGNLQGNAATASKLATARTIQTNLASTTSASFDGTANITPGVTGTLPISNGGTGATTAANARSNLGLGATKIDYTIDLSAYSSSNYYFVDLGCSDLELDCEIHSPNLGGADAYNQNVVHFLMTYQGWSDTPKSFTILNQGCFSSSEITIMSIVAGNQNGLRGVYLRGSKIYRFRSNFIPTLHTSQYSYGNEVYPSGGTSMTCTNATTVWTNNGSQKAYWSIPLYGAVWNDYAEFRICNEEFKPGQVVLENGDDTLSIASQRLQRGCSIVSDTFGFAIGETDEAKCPIAVSGRVLAYGYESREEFKKHIGGPVCSGPNGTVSIMIEEEEEKYPSRIIGTVSAVPDYETWGTGNVKVNNRIWIKVK